MTNFNERFVGGAPDATRMNVEKMEEQGGIFW